MIYPTKSGGSEWFLASDGGNFLGENANRGSDSQGTYYTISSSQVRASAVSAAGYRESDCEWRSRLMDENQGGDGHMQGNQHTWRDVEMTGYFMGTQSGDTEFVPYCRGARHSRDIHRCHGVAYKCAFDYSNGQTRFRKEQWHSSGYVSLDWRQAYGGSTRNRWVGAKFMCYNVGTRPNIQVKLEAWVDRDNNNNWVKVNEYTDANGKWGDGDHCDGVRNQALTWSAPLATFRWDVSGFRFKKFSVREISPAGGSTPPPGPGPGPSPPSTPPPPPGTIPPPPGENLAQRLLYPSSGMTASSVNVDGDGPWRANDSNLGTGWVSASLPAWIKIDLGQLRKLQYMRILWGAGQAEHQTISYSVDTSEDNITFARPFIGTAQVPIGTDTFTVAEMVDRNSRFVRVNIDSNSAFDNVVIVELEAWGDPTPIGQEPPTPPPPPGVPPPAGTPPAPPPPVDPNYVYQESRHVFHVNFASTTSGGAATEVDACDVVLPQLGSGPQEEIGPDVFAPAPPPPPTPLPPPPPPTPPTPPPLPPPLPPPPPPPPETNPPLVISTSPANGTTDVPVTQTITITMSEPMLSSSINSSTVVVSPAVAATYTLTGATNHIITVDPTDNLANSTTYTVTVKSGSTGVKDVAGNALPSNHVFSLTTVAAPDTTPPTILSKTPDTEATGVARDANIVINFSEPMLASRVTDSEIDLWVTSSGQNVPRIVTLSADGLTATVDPISELGGGIQYTVRVRGGTAPSVADRVGNAMDDPDIQWNFTTAAPTYTLIYDYSANGSSWGPVDHNPYKSRGLRLDDDGTDAPAPLYGRRPKKVEIVLRRIGNPGGTTSVKIMREIDNTDPLQEIAVIGTMNTVDITTDSNGATYTFVNDALDHPMEVDDCIVVEASAGTTSNYVDVRRTDSNAWPKGVVIRGSNTSADQDSGRDMPYKIYE